jgi:hypothetical protein
MVCIYVTTILIFPFINMYYMYYLAMAKGTYYRQAINIYLKAPIIEIFITMNQSFFLPF